jgi:hypothetical protein
MKSKFLGLLASVFATLVQCAVANALSIMQTQPFNLDAPQVTFQVSNVADPPPSTVTVTNNSPQSSSQLLTFNQFNPTLGNLTGVTITLTSEYGVTVTVSATNNCAGDDLSCDATVTFIAETTNSFSQKLSGSVISDLLSTPSLPFSASCTAPKVNDNGDPGTCNSGPQTSNNNDFSEPASLVAALSAFSGAGTFDLTATISSALAPRVTPDNGTGFADNATFNGSLIHNWSGNVVVEYTYDPFVTPVPEPLSLYLLATGLGGIALLRRRRR